MHEREHMNVRVIGNFRDTAGILKEPYRGEGWRRNFEFQGQVESNLLDNDSAPENQK
jgi:hypothetical protein